MSWSSVRRALLERSGGCVVCGSRNYRRSRRPPELLHRLLGLAMYRCRDCQQRFLLRRSVASPQPDRAVAPRSGATDRPGAA